MENLGLKRMHPPLGRRFDPHVEAFADMMMDRPVYTSAELGLNLRPDRHYSGVKTTITFPNGMVVDGFISARSDTEAQAEIIYAVMGTDTGVPSVPYIYVADAGVVFSPVPFEGGADFYKFTEAEMETSESKIMRRSDADSLGALDPFLTIVNKIDDGATNRVYGSKGRTGAIDNAMPRMDGSQTKHLLNVLRMARRRCAFGSRKREYDGARDLAAKRLLDYPVERAQQVSDYMAKFLKMPDDIHVRRFAQHKPRLLTPIRYF